MSSDPAPKHSAPATTSGGRVYTRRGDDGCSNVMGCPRVPKNSPVFEALGSIDELNSFLGVAAAHCDLLLASRGVAEVPAGILRAQRALFDAGAHLGTAKSMQFTEADRRVEELEREIDAMNAAMPPLNAFILPRGGQAASTLHVCRSVCRRAERQVAGLMLAGQCDAGVLRYLNRLADWCFVAARRAAHAEGYGDTPAKLQEKH
eukprot:m51a1_g2260 putative atp:cob alamin adenosyltransferase (205) ;mRNA; r:331871-332535